MRHARLQTRAQPGRFFPVQGCKEVRRFLSGNINSPPQAILITTLPKAPLAKCSYAWRASSKG